MRFVQIPDICPGDDTYVNLDNVISIQIMHVFNVGYRILLCTDVDTFTYGAYESKLEARQALNDLIFDDNRISYGKDY